MLTSKENKYRWKELGLLKPISTEQAYQTLKIEVQKTDIPDFIKLNLQERIREYERRI